jgi:hypothetical protein
MKQQSGTLAGIGFLILAKSFDDAGADFSAEKNSTEFLGDYENFCASTPSSKFDYSKSGYKILNKSRSSQHVDGGSMVLQIMCKHVPPLSAA